MHTGVQLCEGYVFIWGPWAAAGEQASVTIGILNFTFGLHLRLLYAVSGLASGDFLFPGVKESLKSKMGPPVDCCLDGAWMIFTFHILFSLLKL